MTNEHDDKLSGLLAQAVQQLVATPRANERPDDLDAMILQKLSRATRSPNDLAATAVTPRKEKRPKLLFAKVSLAASLLLIAGAVTWLGLAGGTNSVYGAVANRLENLRSIVYRAQWVDEAGLINAVAGDGDKVTHLAPSHDRIERPNGSVLVIDTDAAKAIELNPVTKTALLMHGTAASSMAALSRGPVRLLETLRKHFRVGAAVPAGVEALAGKEIGGIRAQGLRSTLDGEIVEAWIDPATSLPLEIRISLVIPSHLAGSADQPIRMWRVMSAFEYNVGLDPSLMSVEVPTGYAGIEMPQLPIVTNAAAPSLTDLIAVLRLCAQHNGSMFPDSLSIDDTPGTCMAIMKRYTMTQDEVWKAGTDAEKQTAMKSALEFGVAIGRVTPFLFSVRPENKLRYIGAGVKLNAPEQPILWFSPQADTQYQVVYADLSVKTVAESALPKLPTPKKAPPEVRISIRSISPRLTFPQSATTKYEALQNLRKQAGQGKVRFIDLHLMPEFLKNNAAADSKVDPEISPYKFLEEFRNLEGLNVAGLVLTENDLDVIGRCQGLKSLSLSGVRINEASGGKHYVQGAELRPLSQLKNLELLDLSQSQFSGGLQHLGTLPKLQTLILSSFENLNDASIAQFQELPHLQTLVLAAVYGENPETSVTEAGLASLKLLPRLRTLYVDYHGEWTLPVEKLQSLLPEVKVQRGFLEVTSTGAGITPSEALHQFGKQLHEKAAAGGN